ncbi:hypothetical protein EC973_000769 [Apophysomyces ossiformis]|uniref:Nucleotide-diphospho-sugar transferase domain-containing protein n=1 Tax=Apophysomyces ossiformis TaxID=679940 RepID=A0A8H7BQ08_9FUNG|nr:hypothetical protein EC973_000769 [Apophysomyces ossiformis]
MELRKHRFYYCFWLVVIIANSALGIYYMTRYQEQAVQTAIRPPSQAPTNISVVEDTATNLTAIGESTEWTPKIYDEPDSVTMDAIERNVMPDPYSKGRVLLTAVVNSGMLDYTLNWIMSLERTNHNKFLVFAIDEALEEALISRGYKDHVVRIPPSWFHVALASDFVKWKSNAYRPITHAKSLVVERLLYLDITVWFSDVDIVLTSPYVRDVMLQKMASRPNTDMAFTQEVDHRSINSGFYIMRPTNVSKQLMHAVIERQDRTRSETQQKIMNRIIHSLFPAHYQERPILLLDMFLFPNGKLYFDRKLPTKLGFEPLMIHANYRIGDEKKRTLRKAGLWYLDFAEA